MLAGRLLQTVNQGSEEGLQRLKNAMFPRGNNYQLIHEKKVEAKYSHAAMEEMSNSISLENRFGRKRSNYC
jgi:hypothetical protein